MKTLKQIILGTVILATALTGNLKAELSKEEGERILQNIVTELVPAAKKDKLIKYGNEYFQYDAYFDDRDTHINGATFIGFDYKADSTNTNDNKADKKAALYGSYYLNSSAPDSLSIRTEIMQFLKGKVDPVIGTEKTSWGGIKGLYR